ncbi:MAG: putative ATPase/Adenylate cyclase, class 3 [Chloroflexi bacterium]|nr:MAG: putative ATPase/Adenylate cyclase, class 3 [Chloroflexota bacterium]
MEQYIPKELLAKLESARSSGMGGERRVVTMLFCDVKGSTAAAQQLDPEDWQEIMNGAFERLIAPVYRYEGTLARLMGDAILAFFGAPIAHEDDPVRAVLAALDILEEIAPYKKHVKQRWGLDFDVRVGINTGLVVVGEVGSDLRMEYTAMGDAINVAARMEQTAEPGTVQITVDTHRLVGPLFDSVELGGIEVKGKDEPVVAFRVIGRKAKAGRLRGIEGLEAPLIGRDAEVQKMTSALDNLQRGVGGIVCLIGEAGLGKSRLIGETRQAFLDASETAHWYETAGLSYETSHPYGLFQLLVRRLCQATDSDTRSSLREKIDALVLPLEEGHRSQAASVLESLFGLAQESGAPMEGETFRGLLFSTMRSLFQARASLAPHVLVFDDLHWADPASVELLVHLMPITGQAPLLLLGATRPDRSTPGWQARVAAERDFPHRYSEVALQPLSEGDSDTLVNSLLTIADLPPALRQRILAKAEGNPFFVEEVVRTLIEAGTVVKGEDGAHWFATSDVEFNVPDNLQALLVARIDRLDEEARQTLQVAAVIGRSFYFRVLQRIADISENLDSELEALQRAEMIRESARLPELEYVFRHSLTQEAAYNTILLRHRREFHRQVGEAIESLFPDRLEELAPMLAHHFMEAQLPEPALKYYTQAADGAFRLFANSEAISHYTQALELAHQIDVGGEALIHLYRNRGRAMELNNQYDEAVANYDEMESLGKERERQELLLAALTARGTVYATQNPNFSPERAEADCAQALQIATELGDRASEAKAHWNLMLVQMVGVGTSEQAVESGRRSLAIARELNLREQLALTLSDLGQAYAGVGQVALGRSCLEDARSVWRELGNLPLLANNLSVSSVHAMMAGDFEEALRYGLEAREICESIGNIWGLWSGQLPEYLGAMQLGEIGRAVHATREADRISEQGDLTLQRSFGSVVRAWMFAFMGAVEAGREDYREAGTIDPGSVPPLLAGWVPALRAMFDIEAGDIDLAKEKVRFALDGQDLTNFTLPTALFVMLARGQLAVSQNNFEQAISESEEMAGILREAGIRMFLADALYIKGQASLALGREDEALATLEDAKKEAEATNSRRILWQVLWALSKLEGQRGNPAAASTLLKQANEIVLYIAENAGEELRDSFLRLPDVQAIVREAKG